MTRVALVLLLGVSAAAIADEHKIKEGEVPKPVLDKVKKKYPTAKMTGFEVETENGKSAYEVKLNNAGKRLEVVCAPDGKILTEEERIEMDAVPEKVRAALKAQAKYGAWEVRHAERVIRDEKTEAPSYEIKLAKGDLRAELLFSPDGKLTKSEEKQDRNER